MEPRGKSVWGLWKGVDISEQDVADVRLDMFRPMLGDGVDEISPNHEPRAVPLDEWPEGPSAEQGEPRRRPADRPD